MRLVNCSTTALDKTTNMVNATCKAAGYSQDDTDAPTFDGEMYCSLGLTARPTEDGDAELVFDDDVQGIVGGRSTNSGTIYGQLAPGDTALHTTHANNSSRVICKGESRQVILMGEGADGKQQLIMIDSNEKQIIISGFGSLIELNQDGIFLQAKGGASLELTAEAKLVGGRVSLGSTPATGAALGGPIGVTTAPGSPVAPSTTVFISP